MGFKRLWALRDYGVEGQLGLEPTFQKYMNKLCDIFDEVKRVLKKDGTCWVVIGDTYNSGGNYRSEGENQIEGTRGREYQAKAGMVKVDTKKQGLQSKCLLQIPSRFSIEMCNRGWILRNEIIWYKPNCMPSSIKDRFTVDFEKVFFFVKNKKYLFETQYESHLTFENRPHGAIRNREYGYDSKFNALNKKKYTIRQKRGGDKNPDFRNPKGRIKRCIWKINTKPFTMWNETSRLVLVEPDEVCDDMMHIVFPGCPHHADLFVEVAKNVYDEHVNDFPSCIKRIYDYLSQELKDDYDTIVLPHADCYISQNSDYSRLWYDFFAIFHNNKNYRKVHVLLTNLSYNSFLKILFRIDDRQDALLLSLLYLGKHGNKILLDDKVVHLLDKIAYHIVDKSSFSYPTSCLCQFYHKKTEKSSHFAVFPEELVKTPILAGCPKGGVVLDPFCGSGTTGVMSYELNRKFIGIDLKKEYCEIAKKRILKASSQQKLF